MSMQVFLDNEPLSVTRPTLKSAFGAAIELAQGRGRVIVEVVADGKPVDGPLLADPPDDPLDGGELRFTSVEPWSMVYEIMHESAEALESASEHQRRASEHILDGKLDEAREDIEVAMGIWQQVVMAIQRSGQLLEIDIESLRFGEPPIALGERVKGLANHLTTLTQGAQNEDWSSMSDLLAYELEEEAENWREIVVSLAKAVRDENKPQ